MTRRFAETDLLRDVVHAAFGPGRHLVEVIRLRGGSKKGVYRLVFDRGDSAVLYSWSEAENYWPTANSDPAGTHADPFSEASGFELFLSSQALLAELGVRTPRLYHADDSRRHYPADIAVLEDVPGRSLEVMLAQNPSAAEPTMVRLSETLQVMHGHRDRRLGKLSLLDRTRQDRPCEQIVLDRALVDLGQASKRVARIGAVQAELEQTTRALAGAVQPRSEYGLIHGELGPDHVLVDRDGQPVIIDVEGLMFFDVEWEHAFLRMRFHEHYRWLSADGLDQQRLRFYTLAEHLSLVAGPLRLLDGDFPDRAFMLQIAEHNADEALSFLA